MIEITDEPPFHGVCTSSDPDDADKRSADLDATHINSSETWCTVLDSLHSIVD